MQFKIWKISARDYFIFHVNTNLLPINLPAFQSAAQIMKIRPEIILYQNFKNRNPISYIYLSEFYFDISKYIITYLRTLLGIRDVLLDTPRETHLVSFCGIHCIAWFLFQENFFSFLLTRNSFSGHLTAYKRNSHGPKL